MSKEIEALLQQYVWTEETPASEEAQKKLTEMGIDVDYVASAVDFTISQLAKFFEDYDNGEIDAKERLS